MVGGYHSEMGGGPTPGGQRLMDALGFLFDGRTGVAIFFVLSGLVLGMALRRGGDVTPGTYLHFCGRRFFRLYPAYFVSTLFFLLLYAAIITRFSHGMPISHGWCDYYTRPPAESWDTIIKNFCFLNQHLNVATWTLKVEVHAAVVLPLLHAFSVRFRGRGEVVMLLALIGLSFWTKEGVTQINLYLFYLGYLTPPLLEILRHARFGESLTKGSWLISVAITALLISHLFTKDGLPERWGILFAGLGSTVLLAAILFASSHPFFSLLDHRAIKFVGMVSYSFYLFNLLSVDLVQRIYFSIAGEESSRSLLGWWIVFPASTLLGLVLSAVSFHFVERPGVRLGGFFFPSIHAKSRSDGKPFSP
jgi:peptidoglycan/LPS O-acetylase OafA/YrhL